MHTMISKLTALIALLVLAGCSLPDGAMVSTLTQSVVREAGSNVSNWIVHQSRAEPLCPLCLT